ncbi:MAG: hypothetical protein ABF665_05940 [Gluconacetobacter sp.]
MQRLTGPPHEFGTFERGLLAIDDRNAEFLAQANGIAERTRASQDNSFGTILDDGRTDHAAQSLAAISRALWHGAQRSPRSSKQT